MARIIGIEYPVTFNGPAGHEVTVWLPDPAGADAVKHRERLTSGVTSILDLLNVTLEQPENEGESS